MDRHALRSRLASLDLTQRAAEEPFRAQMIALLDAQPVVRDTAHRSLADIELQYDAPLPAPA